MVYKKTGLSQEEELCNITGNHFNSILPLQIFGTNFWGISWLILHAMVWLLSGITLLVGNQGYLLLQQTLLSPPGFFSCLKDWSAHLPERIAEIAHTSCPKFAISILPNLPPGWGTKPWSLMEYWSRKHAPSTQTAHLPARHLRDSRKDRIFCFVIFSDIPHAPSLPPSLSS